MSETLVSIIGIVSSLVAIIGLIVELRRSRLSLQTEALLDLDEKFCSEQMKTTRQIAARKLLLGDNNNEELSEILDFLAMVTLLGERKAIDTNLTDDMFGYWIIFYIITGEDYIKSERERDPWSWSDLEKLAKKTNEQQSIL